MCSTSAKEFISGHMSECILIIQPSEKGDKDISVQARPTSRGYKATVYKQASFIYLNSLGISAKDRLFQHEKGIISRLPSHCNLF